MFKYCLFLILFGLGTATNVRAEQPFPKRIYQVPVCAKNEAALNKIRTDLKAKNPLGPNSATEYILSQINSGNILSAEELLKELQESYRKGQKNSPSEVLEPMAERINLLKSRASADKNIKSSIYKPVVIDVSEKTLNETQERGFNYLRKLCNGGLPNPKHPFFIYEFTNPGN